MGKSAWVTLTQALEEMKRRLPCLEPDTLAFWARDGELRARADQALLYDGVGYTDFDNPKKTNAAWSEDVWSSIDLSPANWSVLSEKFPVRFGRSADDIDHKILCPENRRQFRRQWLIVFDQQYPHRVTPETCQTPPRTAAAQQRASQPDYNGSRR